MTSIKLEAIVSWFLLAAVIAIAIWKLFGSPTDTAVLITVTIFIASSGMLLLKALFQIDKELSQKISNIDKSTAVGFTNIRNDISNINTKLDNLIRRKH